MTADHVGELLSPYIDDQVTAEERDRVRGHLETCEACRRHLASLRATVALVRSVEPVAAPEALRAQVRGRVEGVPRGPLGLAWRWPQVAVTRRWAAAAAGAAVVLFVGVFAANLLGPQLPIGGHRERAETQFGGLRQPRAPGEGFRIPGGPAGKRDVALDEKAKSGEAPSRGESTNALQPSPPPRSLDTGFRSVIRTAHLALEVDNFEAAARRLLDIAEGAGGFIADSAYAEDGGIPRGDFTLRVPAPRFSAAIRGVEALGTVRQRQISAQDVTEEFVDLQARQRNLKHHERQLLAFMDRATKVSDLLAVEQELSRVRGEIEQITGRLNFLSHKVDLATIEVGVQQKQKPKTTGLWDFSDTFAQMDAALVASIKQILFTTERILLLASTLVPVAALAAVAWLLVRRVRRVGAGA